MQLYTIPIDIECDNTKRVYKKLDMYGNILCHFEKVPHPDDIHVPMDTTNKQLPNYQGQWIDLTEEKTMRDNIQQKINNGNTTAKATDTQDRPMILRPVEPDEVVKFLERNKDKLEIITIGNKDK